jgi:hypothetical protein
MIDYSSETKEQRSARISDIMTRADKLLRSIPMPPSKKFEERKSRLTPEELQLLEDRNTIVCGSLKKYNKELSQESPHLVSLMEER